MIIVLFRQEANARKKEGGQFRHFEARAAAIALGASRPSPRKAARQLVRCSLNFGNIAAVRQVK